MEYIVACGQTLLSDESINFKVSIETVKIFIRSLFLRSLTPQLKKKTQLSNFMI